MSDHSHAMVNGELVPYAEARVHLDAPALAFAATVFEGLRAYRHPERGGASVFRVAEHVRRLRASMRIMRFACETREAELSAQVLELLRANRVDDDAYVRILAYVEGPGLLGTAGPISIAVLSKARGRARGADTGLSCQVASWTRLADNASPPRVKAAANYVNGRLAMMQARQDGYDTTLLLNNDGSVAEAPSSCFFMVRDGVAVTPPVTGGILESVTRDTLLTLHRELFGRPVVERRIDRSELYVADEMFLCGTGQEVVPVLSVDRVPVGAGAEGPVTRALRERYFAVVRGLVSDHAEWRTAVAL